MPSTTIESAAVDGRARTPRFIQRQLANLHKAITANAKTIQDAIIADTNIQSREAQLEIYLTVRVVRDLYDSFSVEEALSKEYRVANGEDSRNRNDAFGIIYLRPQSHNLVYSIISPLANAIVAGNCVVIEVRNLDPSPGCADHLQSNRIHKALSSKIEEIILQHLDRDTITFVERLPEQLHGGVLLIDQTGCVPQNVSHGIQAPESSARAVALVDRSSDVASAARSIVHARIAFGGQSPYAPDIALVNEFAVEEFLQAAKIALSDFIQETQEQDITALQNSGEDVESAPSENDLRDSGADVIMRGGMGTIAVVEKRYEVYCSPEFWRD
jgi:acyl-CoA reductase-like NAD-dependent aldehyde dehydrogenase